MAKTGLVVGLQRTGSSSMVGDVHYAWIVVLARLSKHTSKPARAVRKNQFSRATRVENFFNGPSPYQPSATAKLCVIDSYIKIFPNVLPEDTEIHRPVLWHPNLHADHIVVNPADPSKITGMIYWQVAHIAPLCLQVRHPAILDFDGPRPESLRMLALPEDFDALPDQEKLLARKLHPKQVLYVLYEVGLLKQTRDAGNALRAWAEIVGSEPATGAPLVECPISFPEEERVRQREDQVKWEEGVELVDAILQYLGAYSGWDGIVDCGEYDERKRAILEFRNQFLDQVARNNNEREAWSKAWAFSVAGEELRK
ncbi:hypothetical protein BJX64DRAFT_282938 [Aspergillus heterothallicus]